MIPPSSRADEQLQQRLTEAESRAAEAGEIAAQLDREAMLLRLMSDEPDAANLVQQVALVLRDWCGCEAVGIRWHKDQDFPYLEAVGFSPDFVLGENSLCAHHENGDLICDAAGSPVLECMCGNVLTGRVNPSLPFFTSGGSFWTNSTTQFLASEADRQSRTRNHCNGEGYESVALIPLRFGDTVQGLLQLNDKQCNRFTPRLIGSLERMAAVLAMRLTQQEAQTQSQKALEQMQSLASEARETADNLARVVDAMSDWVVIYDRTGTIIRANHNMMTEAGHQVLGLSYRDNFEKRHLRWPDGRPVAPEEMAAHRALQGEVVTNEEMLTTTALGEDRSILTSAAPLYKDGQIDGAVASWRDVSELRRVQNELGTNQEFLQSVLNQMPSGVLVVDAKSHRVLTGNQGMHEIWGRDMTGVVMSDFLQGIHATGPHGDFKSAEDWPVMRAIRGEVVSNEVVRVLRPDGALRHVAANAAPIRDDEGRIFAAVVTATDVTESVQAQEELEHYREHLETLVTARTEEVQGRSRLLESVFNNSLSSLVLLDADFNFIRVNRRYAEACARPIEDFAGHNHFVDYPSDELKAVFEDVVRNRRPWHASGRPFVFPDHPEWETTYWDLSLVPIMDPQGQTELLLFSLQDVTERKRSEALIEQRTAELIASEGKYRDLVESANSAIILWDTSGNLTFANQYAERLFGYEPGELIGKPVTDLIADTPQSGLTAHSLIQSILEQPETFETNENENVTKDGQQLWLSWSNRVMHDGNGQLTGIMAIGTDRTAQHQAERELQEQQRKLRLLAGELALAEQKERQRIATGLHDDISQVLAFAKMKLSAAALEGSPEAVDQAQHEVLSLLDEAIRSTRSLTLELSPPVLAEKGVTGAVEWALQRVGEQHGLSTSLTVAGEMRRLDQDIEITVFQAVKEMLNNIVKHAAAAHVAVALDYGLEALRIVVEDDGNGFNPSSIRTTDTGGFGLLNVRERLTYIGGSLTVDSAPGRGARLEISVPVK